MSLPEKAPQRWHHSVQLRHRIGGLQVDVDFEISKPWTILFGPSGSGKTTILRAIAGLVRPDSARIVSTSVLSTKLERSFTFVDTAAGVFMPAPKRIVRLAPQQSALFPHLSVRENMIYGMPLFVRDANEEAVRDQGITKLLASFRIAEVAEKRPSQLSGGEAQRVNLARAVAAGGGGRLLLLDEPFSGFDLSLRDELMGYLLQRQQDRRTGNTLSVTHDVAEAFQLGAEVIKIAEGKVVAQGPVEIVLAEERARLLRQLSGETGSPA